MEVIFTNKFTSRNIKLQLFTFESLNINKNYKNLSNN